MLQRAETKFAISEKAKQEIEAHLIASLPRQMIAGLLLAQEISPKATYWQVAYYDIGVVEGPDFFGLLLTTSNVDFVLPQSNLLESIEDKLLDFQDGSFFVTSQKMTPYGQ